MEEGNLVSEAGFSTIALFEAKLSSFLWKIYALYS
jgi:hypothetical protein